MKPTILIYVKNPNKSLLQEICAGIEEEGVIYEVIPQEYSKLEDLTYESSNASILGTGIGVSNFEIALSLSSLSKGNYVFRMEAPTTHQARVLGTNAARAVKRKAFQEIINEVIKP